MAKEYFRVTLKPKKIVRVLLKVIDILDYHERRVTISQGTIIETPTQVDSLTFQTSEPYMSDTLKVYFNGLKEKFITHVTDTTFEFEVPIISTDEIEVEYVKQT